MGCSWVVYGVIRLPLQPTECRACDQSCCRHFGLYILQTTCTLDRTDNSSFLNQYMLFYHDCHHRTNKYYIKTDISALYAAALILHLGCCIRYIELNWPKK